MAHTEEFQCKDSQSPTDSEPSLMSMLEVIRSEMVSLSAKLSSIEEKLKMQADHVAQPEMNVLSLI